MLLLCFYEVWSVKELIRAKCAQNLQNGIEVYKLVFRSIIDMVCI